MSNSKLTIILALALLISGCVGLKEASKGFLGVSTNAVEKARKDALKMTFDADFDSCYSNTLDILKNIKAYVYAKDIKKQMIAIYVSETDTTPVGIFFNKVSVNKTEIEISSPSSHFRDFIAQKLFDALKK